MIAATDVPQVSVCIANFNGEQLLEACIGSLLDQEGAPAIEIIVHDDASSDGSLALLRTRFPEVRVIESAENVGFCVGNNRMVDVARGEYVLLLNNDACLWPDALARLHAEARRDPHDPVLTLPQYDYASGELVDRGCLLDPFHVPVPNLDVRRTRVAYVIGACLWISRRRWHAIGGFPEWMGSIAEDLYLCCAARLQGAQVRVLAESGYRHRQGASFGGNRVDEGRLASTYRRRHLSERNRMLAALACTPGPIAWLFLLANAASLLIEGPALALLARDPAVIARIYWPALRDATVLLPRALAARRQLMLQRRTTLREYLRSFQVMPRKLRMLLRHGLPSLR